MGSSHSTTLEVSELRRATHSFTNVRGSSVPAEVLNFNSCHHESDWNRWIQWFGWVTEHFWQYSLAVGLKPHVVTGLPSVYRFSLLSLLHLVWLTQAATSGSDSIRSFYCHHVLAQRVIAVFFFIIILKDLDVTYIPTITYDLVLDKWNYCDLMNSSHASGDLDDGYNQPQTLYLHPVCFVVTIRFKYKTKKSRNRKVFVVTRKKHKY